jgi:hypothetical protein
MKNLKTVLALSLMVGFLNNAVVLGCSYPPSARYRGSCYDA